jgi:oligopeptide transport system substrate-binding protein
MRGTTRTVAVAAMSAVALLAAGCGGGGDDGGSSETSSAAAKTGGEIITDGCTPENPLVAGNTAETCGGNILDTMTAKLVHYDTQTAKPENDIAESIETDDNQNFTVKIKQGYKFDDGTEVKAKNFVDAWNYTAYGPNGQTGSYFFTPIEGYDKVGAEDSKVKELSGLKVVDDYTFTIKTSEKVSNLPIRLGYTAFAPQPDAFFADPEAFGKKPIAAGPYKFDSWTEGQSIVLVKNPDYSGDFPGNLDKITWKIYQDQDAAYNDLLAGQIDVIKSIPTSALIDDKFKQDLPDRNATKEYGGVAIIGMNPTVDPRLENPDLRKALSMAIDRDTIMKQIFNNTRTAAAGWVAPGIDGYKADACGEACVYDPEKAKAMFESAGGFDGKLTLSYNGDGDHKAWTEAVCNSIKQTLGVDCVATPVVDFATFLTKLGNNEMKGMFRMGWVMDYPSIENFLAPTYGKGADSNYYDYKSPEFNQLLTEAAAAPTLEEANAKYQEAEAVLAKDFPTIPFYYYKAVIGWSDKVNTVGVTPFGNPDFVNISVK